MRTRAPRAPFGTLTEEDRPAFVRGTGSSGTAFPPTTLIGPVEACAARRPTATAVIGADRELTYGELALRANRLARHLRTLGLGPDRVALVSVAPSVEQVVALLAVLKTGGAFLLEPGPDGVRGGQRPVCVVTNGAADGVTNGSTDGPRRQEPGPPGWHGDVPRVDIEACDLSGYHGTDPPRPLTPQHPACVDRVAGPDGHPRHVLLPHAVVDRRVRRMQAAHELTTDDRVLFTAPTALSAVTGELFWPLRVGAALVVPGSEAGTGTAGLLRAIRHHRVTRLHLGSADPLRPDLRAALDDLDGPRFPTLRRVTAAGSHGRGAEVAGTTPPSA
ncbi:AMP-binding protein [Streptomyces sp. NPDC002055]|uniref:AMP-binding protein n=1 Tax=Streptomyces sp. NPDC002055 TaxID=3154534 RepID=UPI00332A5643